VVPAVGDPDLSIARSLAETIRLGDPDAIAGFRDAHLGSIRSYCAAVCVPELVEDACEASFLEFLGRVSAGSPGDAELMEVLLRSTRSAAAGRFDVIRPQPAPGQSLAFHADTTICAAMPELLAAAANGEIRGDPSELRREQASCATCSGTAARIEQAERAFAAAPGPQVL
jgi:hypothetical protein